MITIANRVGRLIETRFVTPLNEADFTDFVSERLRIMRRLGADRVVCIDVSRSTVLSVEQADRLIEIFRTSRAGLTRNAVLLPPAQAVLALQFTRILRTADNPARRAFTSREVLVNWLAEVLSAPELAQLHLFLNGG